MVRHQLEVQNTFFLIICRLINHEIIINITTKHVKLEGQYFRGLIFIISMIINRQIYFIKSIKKLYFDFQTVC